MKKIVKGEKLQKIENVTNLVIKQDESGRALFFENPGEVLYRESHRAMAVFGKPKTTTIDTLAKEIGGDQFEAASAASLDQSKLAELAATLGQSGLMGKGKGKEAVPELKGSDFESVSQE